MKTSEPTNGSIVLAPMRMATTFGTEPAPVATLSLPSMAPDMGHRGIWMRMTGLRAAGCFTWVMMPIYATPSRLQTFRNYVYSYAIMLSYFHTAVNYSSGLRDAFAPPYPEEFLQ